MTAFTGIADIVAELTAVLEQECDVLSALVAVASREELAIAGGDVVLLTQLTDEKERLLEFVATIESDRMTAIAAIAGATGQDPARVTVSSVIAALPGAESLALASAGVAVRLEENSLRFSNERNAHLLRSRHDVVNRWLLHLRSTMSSVLDVSGRRPEPGSRTRLDRSA